MVNVTTSILSTAWGEWSVQQHLSIKASAKPWVKWIENPKYARVRGFFWDPILNFLFEKLIKYKTASKPFHTMLTKGYSHRGTPLKLHGTLITKIARKLCLVQWSHVWMLLVLGYLLGMLPRNYLHRINPER